MDEEQKHPMDGWGDEPTEPEKDRAEEDAPAPSDPETGDSPPTGSHDPSAADPQDASPEPPQDPGPLGPHDERTLDDFTPAEEDVSPDRGDLDEPISYSQEEVDRPGQSYWEIVGNQFKRNRLAVWSMRILLVLFFLAVYAPVLSHNVPFYFDDGRRSTLEDGDRVRLGEAVFLIKKDQVKELIKDENDQEGYETRVQFLLVDESRLVDGEPVQMPIEGEVTVGSDKDCRICRAGLENVHARFGLRAMHPWVEDLSDSQNVKVNGQDVGEVTFPWFEGLFDRNEFETAIDIAFNLLIFYLPPTLLLFLLLRYFLARFRRTWKAVRFVLVISLLGLFGAGAVYFTQFQENRLPFRDYRLERDQSKGKKSGVFPLIPFSYRQTKTDIAEKPPWRDAFFGTLSDEYKTALVKTDKISIGRQEFSLSFRKPRNDTEGKPRYYLRETTPGLTGTPEIPVEGGILFGAGPNCQIRLTGEKIEPEHARLEMVGADPVVTDLTRSGTVLVNNKPTNAVMESLFSHLYIFGTDQIGRNVFSRILYGTRISLTIGIVAVSIYVFIGIFIGGIAGYFGGIVDILISRVIEIMMCFPSFFLILTLVAILDKNIFYVMLIIGVTRWTGVARLVRGEFLKQKQIDYVIAARALGVSRFKIMFKHILPNAIAPVLVAASFGVAGAILVETGLSFLGLGDVRTPSWGQILNAGRESGEHHLIHLPGLAIFITVAIMNLMSEGLRDALDPKLRK